MKIFGVEFSFHRGFRNLAVAVRDSIERLGPVKAATAIDDDLVRKLAIAETPGQVVQGLRGFFDTGLKLPVAWIVGPDPHRSLDLLARRVCPN